MVRRCPNDGLVQAEIIGDQPRQQEAFAHQRPPRFGQRATVFGRLEQGNDALRTLVDRIDEIAASAILELERNPPKVQKPGKPGDPERGAGGR